MSSGSEQRRINFCSHASNWLVLSSGLRLCSQQLILQYRSTTETFLATRAFLVSKGYDGSVVKIRLP